MLLMPPLGDNSNMASRIAIVSTAFMELINMPLFIIIIIIIIIIIKTFI